MQIRQEESPSAIRALCTISELQISTTTIRDISVLCNDPLSALTSVGLVTLVQVGQRASTAPELDLHAGKPALLKALLLAVLYPQVARVALPWHSVKFSHIARGTVPWEADVHERRAMDMRGARAQVVKSRCPVYFLVAYNM